MRGKRARMLRGVAKGLYLQFYKTLLPEGTELTVDQAIEYSPTLWKKVCKTVKKNPNATLEDLKLN